MWGYSLSSEEDRKNDRAAESEASFFPDILIEVYCNQGEEKCPLLELPTLFLVSSSLNKIHAILKYKKKYIF